MRTCIEILLLEYIFSLFFTREFNVVCARVGGANTTSLLTAHFALRNTASDASEKSESGKERAGRNSPQTPLPPRPKNKIGVAKRFRRLNIKTSKQNNFQFLLKEKGSREKIKN